MSELEPTAEALVQRVQSIASDSDGSKVQKRTDIARQQCVQRRVGPVSYFTNEIRRLHAIDITRNLHERTRGRGGRVQPELYADHALTSSEPSLDAPAVCRFVYRGADGVVREKDVTNRLARLDHWIVKLRCGPFKRRLQSLPLFGRQCCEQQIVFLCSHGTLLFNAFDNGVATDRARECTV